MQRLDFCTFCISYFYFFIFSVDHNKIVKRRPDYCISMKIEAAYL